MSSASDRLGMHPASRLRRESPLIVEADDTTWRTLTVFCLYRIVLSVMVGLAFTYLNRFFNLGVITPGVVLPTVIGYAAMSVGLLVPARLRERSS